MGVGGESAGVAALLRERRRLVLGIRATRRTRSFAPLLLGLVVLGATPLFWQGTHLCGNACISSHGSLVASLLSPAGTPSLAITCYWLLAVPAAFLLVLAYHHHRGHRTGLMRRTWPAGAVGLTLLGFLTLTSKQMLGAVFHLRDPKLWQGVLLTGDLSLRGLAPLAAVGAFLFVLARVERSRTLWVFGLFFVTMALVANGYDLESLLARLGWYVGFGAHRLPDLDLPGVVLLLAALGFFLSDRRLNKKGASLVPEPSDEIDDVVHQRVRLGILTICNEVRRVDFSYLRDNLALTAGNLSRHLAVLEDAHLVEATRTTGQGRPTTWISITAEGRRALRAEVAALRAIVERVEAASAAPAEAATPTPRARHRAGAASPRPRTA